VGSRLAREDFRPAGRFADGLAGLVDLESGPAVLEVGFFLVDGLGVRLDLDGAGEIALSSYAAAP
jgi:hypothetical protein